MSVRALLTSLCALPDVLVSAAYFLVRVSGCVGNCESTAGILVSAASMP